MNIVMLAVAVQSVSFVTLDPGRSYASLVRKCHAIVEAYGKAKCGERIR